MKVQYENSSSKKMRKLIKRTFAELLKRKKEMNKITVTELVNKAEISRGTFYTHYDDIYDVANDYEMETLELVTNEEDDLKTINDIYNYFNNIKLCLIQNEETYKMLLSSDEPLTFLNKLKKIAFHKILHVLKSESKYNTNKYLELDLSIYIDGLFEQFIKYFREQSDYTLDELIENSKKWLERL